MASFSAPTRADARTRTGDPFITSELDPFGWVCRRGVSGLRAGEVPIGRRSGILGECTRRRQLEKHRVVLVEPQLADEPAAVPHVPVSKYRILVEADAAKQAYPEEIGVGLLSLDLASTRS